MIYIRLIVLASFIYIKGLHTYNKINGLKP